MKKIISGVIGGLTGLGFASVSMAAVDLVGVTFPITEFEALAAVILAACAALWVIRRLFGLAR